MRAGDTVFGALLLLWGPGSLTLLSVCEGSTEGGFRPELVEVHNRSVLRCLNSCSQKGPQAGEWTSSPYKLAVSVVFLEDRKGPGLQINFSLAPDANLLYVNKTVIEISMADRRHCVTLQYTGSFTAQVNHRGEPWSFSYIACMTVKPGQSLSISLYNMPYGYQPLTRTLQLPNCENPLMKEYAGELCPAILIHSRLSQGVLNVSYSSSLADPSYLVWLCVWNTYFCSSEDASPLAAPVEVAGRENSVIFHNVTALPCLCVRVISKMSGPHHEGQDCPFRDKRKSRLCWELQRENMHLQQRVPSVRVLLLCSWDHPFFQAVVESLALFLREECRCHMALDMWDRHGIAQLGPVAWLSEQLTVADRVVLVWSRGASRKWEAWRSGLEGGPGLMEPEFGDLFTPGLLHSVDSYLRSGEGRVSVVCFDSDSSRSGIPSCFRDEHVHSLMSGAGKFIQKLSHVKVDFRRTESGQKLQSKLEEFREYQRHSPTWFEEWHRGLPDAEFPKTTQDPSKERSDGALLHGSESEETALEDASCSSSTGQAEEVEIGEIAEIAEIVEIAEIALPPGQRYLSVSSGYGSLSLPESRLLPPKPEPFQDKELGAHVAC
ncbi:UNVERIFIED_CONTAM: hypothetical protein FKN15_015933 [Acipenser sinensis]